MIRTIIESPYAGDVQANVTYLKYCIIDSLSRGEAPFASHLFYTQVLDDTVPEQRRLGIEAGFAWGRVAELVAFYVDRGVSNGMKLGYKQALLLGRKVDFRVLHSTDKYLTDIVKELQEP